MCVNADVGKPGDVIYGRYEIVKDGGKSEKRSRGMMGVVLSHTCHSAMILLVRHGHLWSSN